MYEYFSICLLGLVKLTSYMVIVNQSFPGVQVGDYVFARTGTQTGSCYYVPAIVIATPKSVNVGAKLYTVLMFDNRKVSLQEETNMAMLVLAFFFS